MDHSANVKMALFGSQISMGAMVSLSNLLIVACVVNFEALRNRKEFVLLAALALADAINTGNAVPAYIYRSWVILAGRMNTVVTPIDCLRKPHTFVWLFSNQLSSAMLVCISFDRALLVSLPYTYLKRTARYAYRLVACVYGLSFSMAVAGVVFIVTNVQDAKHSPFCMATPSLLGAGLNSTLRSSYARYLAKSPPILASVSVVLYACICPIYMIFKADLAARDVSGDTMRELARQRTLTRNLAISCGCTFGLYCVPFQLAMLFKNKGMLDGAAVFFLVCSLNAFCNFFIYQWKIVEMRTALKYLLRRKDLPPNLKLWPKEPPSYPETETASVVTV